MVFQERRTIGTSSVKILDRNPNRKYLLLVQSSTGTVNIVFGGPATIVKGVPLIGAGSFFELPTLTWLNLKEGSIMLEDIHLIGSAADQQVFILEL